MTNEEVSQINQLLIQAVKQMESDENITINLNDYKRQYCAYINPKGEKVVHVNCLCSVRGDAWQRGYESVLGGGKCFFGGTINLSLQKFSDFYTNAPK
ncbi:hypothetical protein [Flavobacterium phycosphaerae]|uniref:hypothetical protein n=1 Tax=Flavobacterium phycosphaerae TaxID=2697515 RepID=UPI00138B1AD0|nr:hypothetical protein [Flavobacterium phycosphaerae]